MLKKLKKHFDNFVESNTQYPILSGISAGLYPALYYYGFNFTFVNSWQHVAFFATYFLLIPALIFALLYFVTKKNDYLRKINKYILPCLGISTFVLLTIIGLHGIDYVLLTIATTICIILGVLLHQHAKKIVVFQLVLALIVSAKLVTHLFHYAMSSIKWMAQEDNIEEVLLKKKPNIYVIQPDGYVGFSEIEGSLYNYDNSNFKLFLETNNFKIYPNYRSNYYSTLSSNASLFGMKHHYFDNPKRSSNELYNARKIIAGDNPVISILKNNNYSTHLLLETPYLLVNKPKLLYDYSNINYDEVSNLSKGFDSYKNVDEDLKHLIQANPSHSNFYFIEKVIPGHITNKSKTLGKEDERKKYLKRLEKANIWLKDLINKINANDKNALIIISADHGGFIGLDYYMQCRSPQEDSNTVKSIYSALLAVRLPEGFPEFNQEIGSSVNLFRTLFSYLAEDEKYLKFLQPDESYTLIDDKGLFGTYQVIDNEGHVVFNKKE